MTNAASRSAEMHNTENLTLEEKDVNAKIKAHWQQDATLHPAWKSQTVFVGSWVRSAYRCGQSVLAEHWVVRCPHCDAAFTNPAIGKDSEPLPIPVLLFCPHCDYQHVDAPNPAKDWTNPPHRSHLCHNCGYVWRPSDHSTMGVASISTSGKNDRPAIPLHASRPRTDRVAIQAMAVWLRDYSQRGTSTAFITDAEEALKFVDDAAYDAAKNKLPGA